MVSSGEQGQALFWNPVAVSYVAQLLLATTQAAYLGYRAARETRHKRRITPTMLLAVMMAGLTPVFLATLVRMLTAGGSVSYVMPWTPPDAWWALLMPWAAPFGGVSVVALAMFAYQFPRPLPGAARETWFVRARPTLVGASDGDANNPQESLREVSGNVLGAALRGRRQVTCPSTINAGIGSGFTNVQTAGQPQAPITRPSSALQLATQAFTCHQNQTCGVTGTLLVSYGAPGRITTKTMAGPFQCDDATFGDPAPGVAKSCMFEVARWAGENQSCAFTGSRPVVYGAQGGITAKTLSGPVQCSNAAFGGDPAPNVAKACMLVPTFCAQENGTCSFDGERQVSYGVPGRTVTRTLRGPVACNNTTFGSDPASGVAKACSIL